jgi:hypothetical protein
VEHLKGKLLPYLGLVPKFQNKTRQLIMTKCQWRQIWLQHQPRVSVFQCLRIWVKFKYERRQKAGVGVVKLCIFPITLRQYKLERFSLTILTTL